MNRRQKRLLNEAVLLLEQKKASDFLVVEIRALKNEGMSKYQIAEQFEGLLDILKSGGKSVGESALESLLGQGKLAIAKYIGSFLGIPEEYFDPESSWIACAIVETIKKIEVTKLTQYFKDESQCQALADLFIQAMTACIIKKKVLDNVANALGVSDFVEGSFLDNQFSKVMTQDTLVNMLFKSEFGQKMRTELSAAICSIDLEKVFKDVAGAAGEAGGSIMKALGV